mgnify:CR=1 FL=1
MQSFNLIEKVKKREISLIETTRLLADFFNGEVIEVQQEYVHES